METAKTTSNHFKSPHDSYDSSSIGRLHPFLFKDLIKFAAIAFRVVEFRAEGTDFDLLQNITLLHQW